MLSFFERERGSAFASFVQQVTPLYGEPMNDELFTGGSPMKAFILPAVAILAMAVAGCESTGTSQSGSPQAQNSTMNDQSTTALQQMETKDTSLNNVVDNAYAYAIFPSVGEAAVGIGGAGGHGTVYQHGQAVGTATLHQGSVGVQLGGETYAELVVFQTPAAYDVFKNGNLEFGADASATAIKAGAAAAGQFNHGTRIFILPHGGLMAGAAVIGQKFTFNGNSGM
jgi:lipid-binding SYLF domain-containing protein